MPPLVRPCGDEALTEDDEHQRRDRQQHEAGVVLADVVRREAQVLLEARDGHGRGRQLRVGDEHQRQQEVLERPHDREHAERDQRRPCQRQVDAPEDREHARAVDGRRLHVRVGQAREVVAHEQHAEGQRQRGLGQDHREVGVEDLERVEDPEERHDDGCAGHRQADDDEVEDEVAVGEVELGEGEACQRADGHHERGVADRDDRRVEVASGRW